MIRSCVLGVAALCCVHSAGAVDFGVMETGSAIVEGHWKIAAHPLRVDEYASQEQRDGVSAGFGYGLAERWDLELQFATFDDESLYGADIEYVLLDGHALDASVATNAHVGDSDFGTLWGYGATAITSYTWPGTWVTLNGALDFGANEFDFNASGEEKFGTRAEELHFVPGLQYRLSRSLDIIGEVGVGLSNDARDYAAVGLSYYFRRERDDRR